MSAWKMSHRSILALLALALIAVFAAPVAAEKGELLEEVYKYPVKPGTDAWKALETHEDMLRVSQIDALTLAKMSTPQLVEAVLSYPLLGDILAYNSPQRGFDAVRSRFNGLAELLERPGAGEVLLGRYQKMSPSDFPQEVDLLTQGQRTHEFLFIEMILAQDEILAGMDEDLRQRLLFETLVKREEKLERFDVYGADGLEKTAFVAARTLSRVDAAFAEGADEDLRFFLEEGLLSTITTLDLIQSRKEGLLFGEAASASSWRDGLELKDYTSTVQTPNGSAVTVIVMTSELSSAQVAANNQWVADHYPNAARETNASRRYNCHSYAWYSQSTSNTRWMNTPGDDKYWQDGSYTPSSIQANARISYASDDHSAIAISSSQFRSKWGQLPRMLHGPTYTPYVSTNLNAYFRIPPLQVNMSGPTSRQAYQSGTWSCFASGGVPPYSFSWHKTYSGGSSSLGGGSSKSTSHGSSFNIICDVTDSSNRFASDYTYVNVNGNSGPLPF